MRLKNSIYANCCLSYVMPTKDERGGNSRADELFETGLITGLILVLRLLLLPLQLLGKALLRFRDIIP